MLSVFVTLSTSSGRLILPSNDNKHAIAFVCLMQAMRDSKIEQGKVIKYRHRFE